MSRRRAAIFLVLLLVTQALLMLFEPGHRPFGTSAAAPPDPRLEAERDRRELADEIARINAWLRTHPRDESVQQKLLRSRLFLSRARYDRCVAFLRDTGDADAAAHTPQPVAAVRPETRLSRRRLDEGIRLIKKLRGSPDGFYRHEIDWSSRYPLYVVWYQGKHVGDPAVFFFDPDRGRWLWNHGRMLGDDEDQRRRAVRGGDPAQANITGGLLVSDARIRAVNRILSGLAKINDR